MPVTRQSDRFLVALGTDSDASRASSAPTRSTCTRRSSREARSAPVERAVEICGGSSFFRSKGIERIFRDIQACAFILE